LQGEQTATSQEPGDDPTSRTETPEHYADGSGRKRAENQSALRIRTVPGMLVSSTEPTVNAGGEEGPGGEEEVEFDHRSVPASRRTQSLLASGHVRNPITFGVPERTYREQDEERPRRDPARVAGDG
jgi:hypothetical protein